MALPLPGHGKREEGRNAPNKSIPPMGRMRPASVMRAAWQHRGPGVRPADKAQINALIERHYIISC